MTYRPLAVGTTMLIAALLSAACGTRPAAPEVVVNSIGMRLVRVPAGAFEMGNGFSLDDLARDFPDMALDRLEGLADERPRHPVRITRDFYLGQHEVTVGEFRRFLQASGHVPQSIADGTGGYGFRAEYDPSKTEQRDAFEGRSPRYSWQNPGFAQTEDHPVTNVTWHDAQALAAWLTRMEGVRYRLPTEAEREYACRAGTRTHYPHGNDSARLARHANTFDLDSAVHWPQWRQWAVPGHDGHGFTAPVGRFPPNAFGLHDMVGNVWEWTADWHGDHYYAESPRDDPPGPATGDVRVRRGGSWHTWPLYARCGFRNWNSEDTRYTLVGMRLLRELKAGD